MLSTLLGRIGPKKCVKIVKKDFWKNESNFDFCEEGEIHMSIRPDRCGQTTHTRCFLEAPKPAYCFQNIAAHFSKSHFFTIFTHFFGPIQPSNVESMQVQCY